MKRSNVVTPVVAAGTSTSRSNNSNIRSSSSQHQQYSHKYQRKHIVIPTTTLSFMLLSFLLLIGILIHMSSTIQLATTTTTVPVSVNSNNNIINFNRINVVQREDDKSRNRRLPKLQLRYNYTNLERLSTLAKAIELRQTNCSVSLKRGEYYHVNGFGLGSELHIYSIVLCTAMEMNNVRLITKGNWIYNDQTKCYPNNNTHYHHTSMACYFPHAEPYCAIDDIQNVDNTSMVQSFYLGYTDRYSCPRITNDVGGHSNVRAATTEYLFTRVSQIVQQEAQRQLQLVFGGHERGVPKNLITVHIRWGDKDMEMTPVPIQNYTKAIQQIVDQRKQQKTTATGTKLQSNPSRKSDHSVARDDIGNNNNNNNNNDDDDVNILLCTEDPVVVEQFMKLIPNHWNVYIDQYYIEMLPYRTKMGNVYNVNSFYTDFTKGRNGLIALGSLLVAIEANDYVLTTGSNWSRLINELRQNIIHPRCNNCTSMIDLLYDEI